VWNSDSSWYDTQSTLQQRYSRDLFLNYKPTGGGMAKCWVAISIDSARTWDPQPYPLKMLDNSFFSPIQCGMKHRVKLRVLGQDRPNVAFKVTAQQWKPVIAGNPQLTYWGGITSAVIPGASCGVNLQCALKNSSQGLSYSAVSKVWWSLPSSMWKDSSPALSWTWRTTVPNGAPCQRRAIIAKARDANGLWSDPCTLTVQFGITRLLTMVSLPSGTFQMGSDNFAKVGSTPVHSVTLDSFRISSTLVTQEQYHAVMGINPSYFDSGSIWPVDQVDWYDAALFCNVFSKMMGKDTVYSYTGAIGESVIIDYSKNGYRLPTEAEFEYAYRAGTTTDYYWGRNYPPLTSDDTLALDSNAVWYHNDTPYGSHQVATRKPNAWGLYDMAGNLREWCNDWKGPYSSSAQTNPTGPASPAKTRVLRSCGGWYNLYDYGASIFCAAFRGDGFPDYRGYGSGFRVVCSAR
jgi:formylglycine-generating enzyme required for sulfatase activity